MRSESTSNSLPNVFKTEHQELYDALKGSGGIIDAAHHEYIYKNAEHYATVLGQIFNINDTNAVKALFYSGLSDSVSYLGLSDDKKRTIDKIATQINKR